jgi:hypothetical protein
VQLSPPGAGFTLRPVPPGACAVSAWRSFSELPKESLQAGLINFWAPHMVYGMRSLIELSKARHRTVG